MARAILATAMALGLASGVAAAPPKVLPGEWETSSSIRMQAMPNLPPQVAEMMRQRMGKPIVIRSCITPEEAARGPETRSPDSKCSLDKLSYEGGRMSSEMQCNHDGQITRMKMSGSYTPTSYVMDGQITGSGGKSGPMAMTMHVTGRRISPTCSAGAK